jgi:hypothetical protein
MSAEKTIISIDPPSPGRIAFVEIMSHRGLPVGGTEFIEALAALENYFHADGAASNFLAFLDEMASYQKIGMPDHRYREILAEFIEYENDADELANIVFLIQFFCRYFSDDQQEQLKTLFMRNIPPIAPKSQPKCSVLAFPR